MKRSKWSFLFVGVAAFAGASLAAPRVAAQTASMPDRSSKSSAGIIGTWKAKTQPKQLKNQKRGTVQLVVIRPDSTASYGTEIVRWRLAPARSAVLLALGGEWVEYTVKVKGDQLTLSGGDLPDPVTLTRVGPATPRPAGIAVPPDPDTEQY